MRRLALLLLPTALLLFASLSATIGRSQIQRSLYLPVLVGPPGPANTLPRVNVPYFGGEDPERSFTALAIFWFGAVTPTQNYTDVRVGYNNSELYIYLASFDRSLWYDTTPSRDDLTAWDSAVVYLDLEPGSALDSSSHRFAAQLGGFQAAARGGPAWSPTTTPFMTTPGWRGEGMNDDRDDRGWAMHYRIPFASLGLSERPAEGSTWRLAVSLSDRDDSAGTPIAAQHWPPEAALDRPGSWGNLVFGLPEYTPPAATSPTMTSIRHGLNGAVVPDAGVGGGSICGDGLDFWTEWGISSREAGKGDFNVQNQADIADWPCFAKYYVTFPLDSLPASRVVISATLVLHQFGNAGGEQANPSLIQAFTVDRGWDEATLNWNNAPLATENVGRGWVEPLASFAGWPGVRRNFDLSRAVAAAYAEGRSLRLALYSADNEYHSGKYFVSSDTGDWNAVGRPTLVITLGTPVT